MSERENLWPGWETVRLIGRGSFGAVYEIERDMFGDKEKAALKVITIPQNSSDIDELYGEGYDDASITSTFKSYLKSIVAEYSLMRKMNGSSNVVNCDDVRYVQHDDGFGWDIFIKMELLTPLTKALGKTVTDEQAARIGADICKALVLCRKHDIIHRDIKPANIFVSENGDYKLGDFGIAKTVEKTSGGTKIGTYEYMAPEVYHDQPYGGGADIYSLGMVLYWLLNERRTPFLPLPPTLPTSSEKEQARKRRFSGEALPAPAHGSAEPQRIVLKACAYDPKDRYQTADEMLRDLNALGGAERPQDAPATVPPVTPPVEEAEDDKTVGAWTTGAEHAPERTIPAEEEAKTVSAWTVSEEPATEAASQTEEDETVSAWAVPEEPATEAAAQPEEDKTVGVWTQPLEAKMPESTPAPAPAPEKAKKEKWWLAAVAAVAVVAVVLAAALGGRTTSESISLPFSGEIGSVVQLGHYEQDGNTENGPEPIEWYVIAKDENANMLLLLSVYGLDNVQYHGEDTAVTWAESDLRSWLNSEEGFWGKAFTKGEQERIADTLCRTRAIREMSREDTLDKVFLLSHDDCLDNGIYNNDEWSIATPTAYALSKGAQDGLGWWLRTPGWDRNMAYNSIGSGLFVDMQQLLRPAIWVTADAVDGAEPVQEVTTHPRTLPGVNMTPERFEQEVTLLVEEAQLWTEETAPQSLDEFPLWPQSIISLLEVAEGAQAEMEVTDSALSWTTDLPELLERHPDYKTTIASLTIEGFVEYVDEHGDWKFAHFNSLHDRTYTTTEIPENARVVAVHFSAITSAEGWSDRLLLNYQINNEQIDYKYADLWILGISNHIIWNYCKDEFFFCVTSSDEIICTLRYDAESGQLTDFSK